MESLKKTYIYLKRILLELNIIRPMNVSIFKQINSLLEPKISYKIIQIKPPYYYIACMHSKAVFQTNIQEIFWDLHIIARFHPIHACFLGIEYARFLKKTAKTPAEIDFSQQLINYKPRLQLQSKHRHDQLGYLDMKTHKQFIIKTLKLACSNHLIKQFSTEDAFYIGFYAGNILFKTHLHKK